MRNERRTAYRQLLVIGPPASRRIADFTDAARRLGFPAIQVATYAEALAGTHWPPTADCLVRLESPGGCHETTRLLLHEGIAPMERAGGKPLADSEVNRLLPTRGEILAPRQWYLGFRSVVEQLASRAVCVDADWMSSPERIVTAFDKAACLELWAEKALPIPRQYGPCVTYADLRRNVPERHARLFIKLRYGYSAMGAVALEWRADKVRAITTVETEWAHGRPRLFVTKRPRQLLREQEIAWLIDTLAMEEIIVEKWLPKARWNSQPFDLRVMVIDDQMQHVVGRASASPFTNLNLDARRMASEQVQQHLGATWADLEQLVQHAAQALPGWGPLGLDVVVSPHCDDLRLLEANAFGGYLPGLQHQGHTTYEAELFAIAGTAPTGTND